MNAAARALTQGTFATGNVGTLTISRHNFGIITLIIAILVSAFAVVYVKDLNRRLFSDLQVLQQARDSLHTEWGQLLLEQNTWATQARVQSIAQQRLDMVVPLPQSITMMSVK